MSARVINTLRERLEVERQIDDLLGATSEEEYAARARQVAESGAQVIPAVLHKLCEADPRQLNALGVVASLYPRRDEILNKLYETAADSKRPDRERVSAMLILERFLNESPDPYLLQTLEDPRAVAIESVRDLIQASTQDPSVLLEYTRVLSEQSIEAIEGVIDTLLEIGQEKALPALCLMAQVANDEMAATALHAIGRVRDPEAAQRLQGLLPLLPPDRRALGERSYRKLQLAGVPIDPLPAPDPAWRALVSPPDGSGTQVVWFLRDPDAEGRCPFVGVVLLEDGLAQAYGNHSVPAEALPERGRPGYLHRVPLQLFAQPGDGPEADAAWCYVVEADLDYGRRLLWGRQARQLEEGRSLPPAYRLLGQLIWRYDTRSMDEEEERLPTPVGVLDLLPQTGSLPYHPFFRGWYVRSERATALSQAMSSLIPSTDPEAVHAWAARLAQESFDEAALEQLAARLRAMSRWLWQAEQVQLVELAMVAVDTVTRIPPSRHPLTLGMAELGLSLAMQTLRKERKGE